MRHPHIHAILSGMVTASALLAGCVALRSITDDNTNGDNTPGDACELSTSSTPLAQVLETDLGFSVFYPAGWTSSREENLYSLYSVTADELPTADLNTIARIVISTEQRADHEDALGRLSTIEAESDVDVTSLTIAGWPAIQRCQIVSVPQPGNADSTNGTDATVKVVTTAIAADALMIRLEGTVPTDASQDLVGEVVSIGRSVALLTDVIPSSADLGTAAISDEAGGAVAEGVSGRQILETDDGFQLSYPAGWSARKVANIYMILNAPAQDQGAVDLSKLVQVVVHSEMHADHTEAAARLTQIAAESDTPATRLEISGWPALERTQVAIAPRPGKPGGDGEIAQVLVITTAVAADKRLVRLETSAPPDADSELVAQVLAIGRSLTFDVGAPPE